MRKILTICEYMTKAFDESEENIHYQLFIKECGEGSGKHWQIVKTESSEKQGKISFNYSIAKGKSAHEAHWRSRRKIKYSPLLKGA